MSSERISEPTQPQRDRLAFVELRVRLIGDNLRQGCVRLTVYKAMSTDCGRENPLP